MNGYFTQSTLIKLELEISKLSVNVEQICVLVLRDDYLKNLMQSDIRHPCVPLPIHVNPVRQEEQIATPGRNYRP